MVFSVIHRVFTRLDRNRIELLLAPPSGQNRRVETLAIRLHFIILYLVYGALVAIVIMSLYLLFKTIGLSQMFSMGIGGLLKITLFFAYLGLFETEIKGTSRSY